jgi:hypothetical protein
MGIGGLRMKTYLYSLLCWFGMHPLVAVQHDALAPYRAWATEFQNMYLSHPTTPAWSRKYVLNNPYVLTMLAPNARELGINLNETISLNTALLEKFPEEIKKHTLAHEYLHYALQHSQQIMRGLGKKALIIIAARSAFLRFLKSNPTPAQLLAAAHAT